MHDVSVVEGGEGTSVAHSRAGTGLYHNIALGLGEAWNSVMLSRAMANSKLLLHKEEAEYGGEVSDSLQEYEDFMLVSQEIQASISQKHSISYRSLLPKTSGGKHSKESCTECRVHYGGLSPFKKWLLQVILFRANAAD